MKEQVPSTFANPGSIVLFYNKGSLLLAIVTFTGAKSLTLLTEDQEELKLSPSRCVLVSSTSYEPCLQSLKDFAHSFRDIRLGEISIPDSGLDFDALQEALDIRDDAHRFALYCHLKDDPETYYQKHELFFRRSAHEKQDFLRAKAKAQRRKDYLRKLRDLVKDPSTPMDDDFKGILIKELRLFLQGEKLEDLHKALASNALDPIKQAVLLRTLLKDSLPVYDPALAASGLPVSFDQAVLDIPLAPSPNDHCEDEAFCIDDEDSMDFDDALSIRELPDGYVLGIHVSNLAHYIKAGDALFDAARQRVSSLYLPPGVVPMLPHNLSEDALSLVEDHKRGVLSLYVRLSRELDILSTRILSQKILIKENLSYSGVDKAWNEPRFILLKRIAESLRKQRDPETREQDRRFVYNLKLSEDKVKIKRIDLLSPSRMMIEEMMIFYNRSMADFAQKHDLPMLFRNIKRFAGSETEPQGSSAFLDTSASYHPGIGAHGYLHATSPIRRLVDLINQMQIMAKVSNQDLPFSSDKLQEMIPHIEKRIQIIRTTMQRSERYWLLHMIRSDLLNKPLNGIVKGSSDGKYRAEILPWGKQVLLKMDAAPINEEFSFVAYDVDLDKMLILADLIY